LHLAQVISNPSGFGGAERVVQVLAEECVRRGHRVTVLNPFARGGQDRPLARVSSDEISYFEFQSDHLLDVVAARRWLAERIRTENFDLVHVHLFHAAALLSSFLRLPHPLLGTHHHGELFVARRRWRKPIDRWAFRRMDAVVAVSDSVQQMLARDYRIPTDKVRLIRNGWTGRPEDAAPASSHPVVVSVGNLRVEKNHIALLEAFVSVVRQLPGAELRLIGSGPLESSLRKEASKRGIAGSVNFVGHVEDVWPHLVRDGVFVLPSRYETSGVALVEAMAAGMAVVATPVGGVTEVARDGHNALLTDPSDPGKMARQIVRLLQDRSLRHRLIEEGQRTAQDLTTEKMVNGYFDLYMRFA
jgi:glycosyltransferase involved in cell wall biosynthesis